MFVDLDEIVILERRDGDLRSSSDAPSTSEILKLYAPEFAGRDMPRGSPQTFRNYFTTLVEAWLRDYAFHWKSKEPPGSEDLTKNRTGPDDWREDSLRAMLEPLSSLYIETNFLWSIATGRDPDASSLLTRPPDRLQVAIPQICFMEALSVLNHDRRQRNQFKSQLESQIGQLRSAILSPRMLGLCSQLAGGYSRQRQAHRGDRYQAVLRDPARGRELDVHKRLATSIWMRAARMPLILDPTDNLILYCILTDARSHPDRPKIFLSGNRNDFGGESVQQALRQAGVNKSFWTAKQFLDWFTSQANRDDSLG